MWKRTRLIVAAFFLLAFLSYGLSFAETRGGEEKIVYVIDLDMDIDGGALDTIERGVGAAEMENATAIIQINTNGGYLGITQNIVDILMDSKINIVAFIGAGKRAFSAGAYIAMATKSIYMTDGGVIGSGMPVDMSGQPASEKVINAMAAWMRSLAEAHGRNVTAAELMVTKNLDFTASEADRYDIAEKVADFTDVLAKSNLGNATIRHVGPSLKGYILSFLSNPLVVSLLASVLFVLIWVAPYRPYCGTVLAIALTILVLYGFGVIGVTPLAIVLVMVGFAFIILEMKVRHGVGGLIGVILSILGALIAYSYEPFAAPTQVQYVAVLVALVAAGMFGFYVHKIRGAVKMRAKVHDISRLVGRKGIAKTDLRPGEHGVVWALYEEWSATSEETIEMGETVDIIGVEELTLKVRKTREGWEDR